LNNYGLRPHPKLLNRQSNQRPQRTKPDPRQLAFPIEDPQEELPDMELAIAPPLLAGRRKTEDKGAV
jgi:hypothetical protein